MRRTGSALALVLSTALIAGACTASPKVQTPATQAATASTGNGGGAPAGFEDYYDQTLIWKDCGKFECATARAPLSWQDPGAGEIELAVKRHPATGEKIGSLLTNPGGPGGSGTEYLDWGIDSFGDDVQKAYDIVSFDPRGVKKSSAIECFDDARKDESLSKDFDSDEAGRKAMAAEAAAWGAACEEKSGELLGQVDTQSAARDMDMLRAALGDSKLTYLGFSYGTQLGATYAGLFPERAGRLVLDGAVDVTLTPDESAEQQAVGFENALRAYVADCQGGADCPLTGSVDDGMKQIKALLDRAKANPLSTGDEDGRRLTQTLAFYGIATPLYNNENWGFLTQALSAAIEDNDGSTLLYLADYYNDRNEDGTFATNSAEAIRAVNCLDGRQNDDPAYMAEQAKRLAKEVPTLGESFAYGGLACHDWPYPVVKQDFDLHAKGAAPIVVIGTTNDPATPYVGAQALAKTLDSGVLVTYKGEGHTAYGRSNSCITDAVDDFFLDGTVPKDGLTC